MKKYLAFLGSAMFFVVCFSLYLMLESSTLSANRVAVMDENDLNSIEAKIKQIEDDLKRNHKTINMIKDAVQNLVNGDKDTLMRLKNVLAENDVGQPVRTLIQEQINVSFASKSLIAIPSAMCGQAETPPPKPDVQMFDVYRELPFNNPDGGVWKQGYPITYDVNQWKDQPLQVFVVPHSHNDPGWIKTFERYYQDQTRYILDNMVEKLEQHRKMTFIYAEISFFSLWWSTLDLNKRERVKKLIQNNQFEIVTGGWVMTDEANAHYFAMIDQMIEGNQWLEQELGYKPQSGWAIDPFGHSATMAYLLGQMGLKNMLIQRTHYAVKKYLSQKKSLEFRWRQTWDHAGNTDMFCHMMPFYSYDVPHTCGPDPKICCQFDFKRLAGGRVSCPWRVPPVPITPSNVAQRAEMLLDQYRKKAQLYRSNVVLIPLGDDFRYDKAVEWDQQTQNYQQMFDYMNSKSDWKVQAQFGTLSDYFKALRKRSGTEANDSPKGYPILTGDFFSYADRDQHYWTGYFTSRPFYKRLDRLLESHLRGGEVLFSLAAAHAKKLAINNFPAEKMMKHVVGARRSLGLFQHHDGITGTAKDFVMVDYGTRMLNGLMDLKKVIATSAQLLMTKDKGKYVYDESAPFFNLDELRQSHDALPEKTVVKVSYTGSPVVFYNSLGHSRVELVRVYVNQPHVQVCDPDGKVIPSQADPYWINNMDIAKDRYKLVFVVKVAGLSLTKYTIKVVGEKRNPLHSFGRATMYNTAGSPASVSGPFTIEKGTGDFMLTNNELMAQFSGSTGLLQSITTKADGQKVDVQLEFLKYGTVTAREKSGAYLFLPGGEAQAVPISSPFIRVIRGSLLQEVHVFLPHVEHVVRLASSSGVDSFSLEIVNLVDIRSEANRELAMRIHTNIANSGNVFYTDLNGFQMIKRQTLDKLPLQANFYPMPTMAYLQDAHTRLTVLTGQSLGVAGLKQGWLEIIQDRRLNQDDNRGLGQGVLDNKRTPNKFRILVERRQKGAQVPPDQPSGFPSLLGHLAQLQFIHPIHALPKSDTSGDSTIMPVFKGLSHDLPCELHLLHLRSLQHKDTDPALRLKPREDSALLLHRLGFDCSFPAKGLHCMAGNGKITLIDLFSGVVIKEAWLTSLSLMHTKSTIDVSKPQEVQPMEIKAYKVVLR